MVCIVLVAIPFIYGFFSKEVGGWFAFDIGLITVTLVSWTSAITILLYKLITYLTS